ncbi:DUF6362 family protein [Roseibium sp.]|uniref:DUF6362 family protein n=1 Tax=Roseibium sp. TaxID=1936156 RepID=UPI003BA86B90
MSGCPESKEIMSRLVEAMIVVACTAKGDGPKSILSAWPDFRRKVARRKRTFEPRQISRAEEALTWFALVDDLDSRRALQFEVMCKAGGGPFSRTCEKYGWKRSTVTSRNRVVLKQIARKLEEAA